MSIKMNIELHAPEWEDYELLDSGNFEKLERFGPYVIARPEPQAIWNKSLSDTEWEKSADSYFVKDKKNDERGEWVCKPKMPAQWFVNYGYKDLKIRMRLGLTSFKHVGIFPEQAENWNFIYDRVRDLKQSSSELVKSPSEPVLDLSGPVKVLNLFAYTGGASLAACGAGAEVTHVDSVKQVVTWARENMEASGMDGIRWIVEDALKFVRREVKRGKKYHGIILDPPAYGRGTDGERWILEENINEMLSLCGELLDMSKGSFLVINLYSMGMSALLAKTAVSQLVAGKGANNRERGKTEAVEKNNPAGKIIAKTENPALGNEQIKNEQMGELYFEDSFGKSLPLGVYYRFFR